MGLRELTVWLIVAVGLVHGEWTFVLLFPFLPLVAVYLRALLAHTSFA